MPLSVKDKRYMIPNYSLTGDLLSFEECGLQYRYYNRGALPPSTPVQLWFGEFIHGVLEEAYLAWRDLNRKRFPWPWIDEIHPLEVQVADRLRAAGLYPNRNLYCPFAAGQINSSGLCPDANHPHQLLASMRSEAAINTWGQHLFPLIHDVEVKLKCLRDMPNYAVGTSRSNYYGVTGIIDVISSVNLLNAPSGNLILHGLHQVPEVQAAIANLSEDEYEVIIDYKGMRRPPARSRTDSTWLHHEMQILTYAWLRGQQPNAKPIVAGMLFYLNELSPSKGDLVQLKREISNGATDILPSRSDTSALSSWRPSQVIPRLSRPFLESRSMRVIPIDPAAIQTSLQHFDQRVDRIEIAVRSEMNGGTIPASWPTNPKVRTCDACDFKTYCPNPAKQYPPTAP